MAVQLRTWIVYLLLFHCYGNCLDCDRLTNREMRNIDQIVSECVNATSLGRHPDSFGLLEISYLSDAQFASLFKNKETLNIGILAINSKLTNMTFPKLKKIDDAKEGFLLQLLDNRRLETLSLPEIPPGTFCFSADPQLIPIQFLGNPALFFEQNIKPLIFELGCGTIKWKTKVNYKNKECMFFDVVSELSDLNHCETVKGNLMIDEAVGKSNTHIIDLEGYLSITNSNISNMDFLHSLGQEREKPPQEREKHVISNNPHLCLDKHHRWIFDTSGDELVFENNKPRVLCDEPTKTCVGGNLRDTATRLRIENENCVNVLGDIIINNLINDGSELTESLKRGLARIKHIIHGSLIISYNNGLESLNLLPNIETIDISDRKEDCKGPAIAIWANFNLKTFDLNEGRIFPSSRLDCPLISIGANGKEGREELIPEVKMNEWIGLYHRTLYIWKHPKTDGNVPKRDHTKTFTRIGLIMSCTASGCLFLVVLTVYVYKMRKRNQMTESNGSESSDGLLETNKPAKLNGVKVQSPAVGK